MALTATDKIKIQKYLREHALGDIYYLEMCDAIGKKQKPSNIEFIDYFTEYIITELRKDTKINIKQLTKVISVDNAFIKWAYEDKNDISEEILNKIRSFEDFYNDYLERTGIEVDEDLRDNYIKIIIENVNKLFPNSEKSEVISKYIKEIAALTESLKQTKKELDKITKEYEKLQKKYTEDIETTESQIKTIEELREDKKNKKQQITNLNKTIDSLNNRITELEILLSQIKQENENLTPYKEKYEKIVDELEELKKIVKEENKIKKAQKQKEEENTQIEALIYEKLLRGNETLDSIVTYIKTKGIATTREEIYTLLTKIRKIINVESNIFMSAPTYQIVSPNINENKQYNINLSKNCKQLDIMLVADFHIQDINQNVVEEFDKLYNYCTEYGINIILNIGDFYQALGSNKIIEYQSAIDNYKLIEKSISDLPYAKGIYHGILGGNHDKNILKYGFDPIKILTEAREDFINLGYTRSTILLNKKDITLGKFDIHHPDDYSMPIELDSNGFDIIGMEQYLDNLYKNQGRIREDSYIDIFGHTHRSQFNFANSYYYLPSYTRDRTKRGANHLKIYFDDQNQISYMVFIPLSVGDKKLTKTNEIIYKKTLHK